MYRAKVINLFAGPGAGKSQTMAGIFHELKLLGVDCEQAPEVAKDLTWEERKIALGNQALIFGKQLQRIWRIKDRVDVIISDSPLPFSVLYNRDLPHSFNEAVIDIFNSFNNMNYFVVRVKPYNPNGRSQTVEEAIQKDVEVLKLLKGWDIPHKTVTGDREGVGIIVKDILKLLEKEALL